VNPKAEKSALLEMAKQSNAPEVRAGWMALAMTCKGQAEDRGDLASSSRKFEAAA